MESGACQRAGSTAGQAMAASGILLRAYDEVTEPVVAAMAGWRGACIRVSAFPTIADATMKTISRRICGVVLGLGVLGFIVPVVRADEMADWMAEMQRQNEECRRKAQEDREAQDRANQQAQAEQAARDRAYQEAQQEQAARDRAYREAQQEQEARAKADYEAQQQREAQDKSQADKESWDKYWREWQQTQDERAAWYEKQRREQEWEEWMNRGREDWWAAGSDSTKAPVARPAGLVILNPFALEKMAPKDQKSLRQLATQMGQTIMQEQQIIQNPFVRLPK